MQPCAFSAAENLSCPDRWRNRSPKLKALRPYNLCLWQVEIPVDFAQVGQHSERGTESLGPLLPLLASHDLLHLDQHKCLLMAFV